MLLTMFKDPRAKEPKVPQMMHTLQISINDFLTAKALTLSPNTIADYRLTLDRFGRYLGPDTEISGLEPRDLRSFLATLPGKRKTVLNSYIALSSMWTWMIAEGYVTDHIVRRVEAPKPEETIVKPFSQVELGKLLANLGPETKRDRAMILFLVDTGVRASELCGIKLTDLQDGYARVLGKGGKEREVPVSDRTWRAVLEYFHHRNGQHARYLFTTDDGRPYNRHALRKLLARLGERAGVPNCHPHRFRHTFAVNYLLNGGDSFTLQRVLGHSTMDMVNRYLALTRDDLAKVHQKASPVKNWGL
jgi:site-specific recombinase XerD